MELRIKFETEIKYSDNISLNLDWSRKLNKYIIKNIYSLDRDYYPYIRKRLIRYPHFYYSGYIKFFTKKEEIIYPFDSENSKTIRDFMNDELSPIVLSTFFPEKNEPTTLNIKLELNLVEKI